MRCECEGCALSDEERLWELDAIAFTLEGERELTPELLKRWLNERQKWYRWWKEAKDE